MLVQIFRYPYAVLPGILAVFDPLKERRADSLIRESARNRCRDSDGPAGSAFATCAAVAEHPGVAAASPFAAIAAGRPDASGTAVPVTSARDGLLAAS